MKQRSKVVRVERGREGDGRQNKSRSNQAFPTKPKVPKQVFVLIQARKAKPNQDLGKLSIPYTILMIVGVVWM